MDPDALQQFQMHGQDIPWLLAHWAEHRPDHPVLIWDPPTGESRQWTYRQLLEDTHRLAAGLVGRGVAKGDKVLIHSDNCPELVLAWLACATVGAVGVTTNTKSVGAELTYFIDKAQCVAAITQPQYAAMVVEAGQALRWVAVTSADDGQPRADLSGLALESFDDLFGEADAWPGRPIEPLLPFGANAIWASRIGPQNIDLGPDDRYLIYLPFFHVNAQSWSFFPVLGVGATAVLVPKWSTSRFWEVVEGQAITHISLMPFVMGTLGQPDRPKTKLRVGVFGLILPDLDRMFGIAVYAAYGMTELVSHAVTGKPSEQLPTRSMGRVSAGYEIAVVDKETGHLCAEGQTGELWMRGTRGIQIFLEYYDNPEANASSFEDGWFKTGDMVQMGPGGNVFYQERDKDLIKVGGENVSAREVEDVVTTVPGIAQAAVVGKKHEWLDQVVVVFVITTPGAPDPAELERQVIHACASKLAGFKVPRAVYVVEEFPLGTLDKLLKNKLRDLADEQPDV
jgi:crotonobetaine/carnitine-CoA ligase